MNASRPHADGASSAMAKKKAGRKNGMALRGAKFPKGKAVPVTGAALSASAIAFAEFLHEFGLYGPPPAPLMNITFFLGPGFSKAWDASYPTGPELFQVTSHERTLLQNVERAANFSGLSPIARLSLEQVRHLVYTLDMNVRYTDCHWALQNQPLMGASKSSPGAGFSIHPNSDEPQFTKNLSSANRSRCALAMFLQSHSFLTPFVPLDQASRVTYWKSSNQIFQR